MKEKNTLLRIVRDKDGSILIDTTGKKAGRGAYICNRISCFEAAKKGRRLEKSFKSKIASGIYDELQEKLEEDTD